MVTSDFSAGLTAYSWQAAYIIIIITAIIVVIIIVTTCRVTDTVQKKAPNQLFCVNMSCFLCFAYKERRPVYVEILLNSPEMKVNFHNLK